MTDAEWSYIFKKGPYPEGCRIPEETLAKLRYEFDYWYPMDLRCSGKDLIRNHLTMSLYNHAAVWDQDLSKMPRGYFCNGYVLVNGEKMSKSLGNFLTMRDCIERYGVDATRVALADAGDTLDDANFDELVANSAIQRLFIFERWIIEEIRKNVPETGLDYAHVPERDLWDQIFENEISYAIEQTTRCYAEIKYKQGLKHGFFEPQAAKEDYLLGKGTKHRVNPFLLLRFIETQLILLNPITPHFAEYCWETHVRPVLERAKNLNRPGVSGRLIDQGWPQVEKPFDPLTRRMYDYVKSVKSNVRLAQDKARGGGKKAKAPAKGSAPEAPLENVHVFIAGEYPDWQKQVLELLAGLEWDANNQLAAGANAYVAAVKEKISGPKAGLAMKFAAFTVKEAAVVGKDLALEVKVPFNEAALIQENNDFIFSNAVGVKNVKVISLEQDPEGDKAARE